MWKRAVVELTSCLVWGGVEVSTNALTRLSTGLSLTHPLGTDAQYAGH